MDLQDFSKIIEIIENRDKVKVNTDIPPFGNRIYMFSECAEIQKYSYRYND